MRSIESALLLFEDREIEHGAEESAPGTPARAQARPLAATAVPDRAGAAVSQQAPAATPGAARAAAAAASAEDGARHAAEGTGAATRTEAQAAAAQRAAATASSRGGGTQAADRRIERSHDAPDQHRGSFAHLRYRYDSVLAGRAVRDLVGGGGGELAVPSIHGLPTQPAARHLQGRREGEGALALIHRGLELLGDCRYRLLGRLQARRERGGRGKIQRTHPAENVPGDADRLKTFQAHRRAAGIVAKRDVELAVEQVHVGHV